MSVSAVAWSSRLTSVRATAAESGLDAVVITHPPNVRYLSGFAGSTGALVIDGERCSLVVDFRYITSARDLRAAHRELALMCVVLAERSEDETIVELLLSRGADPALTTCRGESAHDIATSRSHPEIAALLANHAGSA